MPMPSGIQPGVPSWHQPPATVCPARTGHDRQKMSKQTESSLFIFPSFSRVAAFYQRLLNGIKNYEELSIRILRRIETAHAFRQVEQVRELARVLIGIPIRQHQLTAQYYLIWCECREFKYNDEAVLERIIEQSQNCKTRALFSRGAFEWYRGNNEAALYFYLEALKTSPTVSEYVDLSRTIAVVKGTEGFHKSAIRDLENLFPVVRYAEPRVYYDYLNTLAVELGEVGRLKEARSASQIALASPFAGAYPEWRETREEIELRGYRASRSRVAVGQRSSESDNLVRLPAPEHSLVAEWTLPSQPARVLSFLEGKKKMVKESNGPPDDKKNYKDMDGREMLLKIMEITGAPDRTDYELYQILEAIEEVLSNPKPKEPDKE
jgi:tetratricopeptide (TPR) repeat protein